MNTSTSAGKPRTPTSVGTQIPYEDGALEWDLHRVRSAWEECQSNRQRSAIYGYLEAVYDLVEWWSASGSEAEYVDRALWTRRLRRYDRETTFAALIRCTSASAKVDKRTRSKWSRVLRFASEQKPDAVSIEQFITRHGGINACASRMGSSG